VAAFGESPRAYPPLGMSTACLLWSTDAAPNLMICAARCMAGADDRRPGLPGVSAGSSRPDRRSGLSGCR
jgi:hypothetical protein